ncbi:MmcQ/YjbR family DNA-binding protein [Nocardia sp. NPDC004573]
MERPYEVYVRGRLKFRVKQIVYVSFSLDETVMGFAFPREERAALIASEPHKFQMPSASDMRFNWIESDLAALDPTEARELVIDASFALGLVQDLPARVSRFLRDCQCKRVGTP